MNFPKKRKRETEKKEKSFFPLLEKIIFISFSISSEEKELNGVEQK